MKPFHVADVAVRSDAWPALEHVRSPGATAVAAACALVAGAAPDSGAVVLHRAFTEVPDYGIASRGFSAAFRPGELQGLPSYDEAEPRRGGIVTPATDSQPHARCLGVHIVVLTARMPRPMPLPQFSLHSYSVLNWHRFVHGLH